MTDFYLFREFSKKYPDPNEASLLEPFDVACFILTCLAKIDERGNLDPQKHNFSFEQSVLNNILSPYNSVESQSFRVADVGKNPQKFTATKVGQRLELLVCEAWQWLMNQGFLAKYADTNRFFVTRKGKENSSQDSMTRYLLSRYLSVDILHPKIQQKVYSDFSQGDFDSAVHKAFKQVEAYARGMGKLDKNLIGAKLFDQFFGGANKCVLPSDYDDKDRTQLLWFFKSSYDLFRNPASHRNVELSAHEAVEMIMVANHCLRVLERIEVFSEFDGLSEQDDQAA